MPSRHRERHRAGRSGWLRAAVLGANDGIISTASLLIGVASAGANRAAVVTAGVAGLVAGAMSMAAGEYVSVSSQADAERADLDRERKELETDRDAEHRELAAIYMKRGLEINLAREVASQLMAHDALGAHARDELGISESMRARPLQAAGASAITFALGASIPLSTVLFVSRDYLPAIVSVVALSCLASLGALAAHIGGASAIRGAARVSFWGAMAMSLTAAVGSLFGL
jgi:vacuolar iron transporter family protein